MTLVLLIMIVVGLAIAAAGLAVAIRAGWRLYKMGRRVQRAIDVEVQAIVARQELVLQRMSSIEENQQVLAERMERLKNATRRLGLILGELAEARSRMTRVP